MNNEIEEKINKLIKKLMCDYECGRTIDEVKTFDHPDEEVVIEIIGSLRKILFPGYYRNKSYRVYTVRNNVSMLTEDVAFKLINQIRIVLRYDEKYENADESVITEKAEEITFEFLGKLPKIREYVETDVQADRKSVV